MATPVHGQLCRENNSGGNMEVIHSSSCVQCLDGSGEVECFQVFPGIRIFFNQFHAWHCEESYGEGDPLQINFCYEGRFECSFSEKECCILGPGDMSVHSYHGKERKITVSEFPLGYYQGIGIYLDCDQAEAWMRQELGSLAPDLYALQAHLLSSGWYLVRKADRKCSHVFQELSELMAEKDTSLLRLKVLELLFLLLKLPDAKEEFSYFPKYQVELVKRIHRQMVEKKGSYLSLEKLADDHHISVTQLQKIFKSLYGVTVYQYLREYRLEEAAVALLRTENSITEIALEAG